MEGKEEEQWLQQGEEEENKGIQKRRRRVFGQERNYWGGEQEVIHLHSDLWPHFLYSFYQQEEDGWTLGLGAIARAIATTGRRHRRRSG